MEARLSEGVNPEIDGVDMVQVCLLELSGEAFDSVTTLPLQSGDLGVFGRCTRNRLFLPYLHCLGRSLSGDTEQEDEGMGTPRGILPIAGSQSAGVGPSLGPGSLGRSSAARGQQNTSEAPRGGRGRAATPRAGSPAAIQLQFLMGSRSFLVPHHGAGAANSGTASCKSESNIPACPPHTGCFSEVDIFVSN